MRPNFLVIGAPKCATTALCHHLGQHPEVFMSVPKETFFFSYDDVYQKGITWYESIFASVDGEKAIGEGTTVYSQTGTFPKTLDRIVEHVPDASIIYVVRHPLERIQSHWIEMHSQGLTMLPFNKAVIDDPQYVDASSYHKQLSAYQRHFSDEKILVLFYEDIKSDANAVLEQCFRFLDVDPGFKVENASKPRYSSEGKRRDLPITNFIRSHVPGFMMLRDMAPMRLRSIAKKVLKREIAGKPDWDVEVKEAVACELREDTKKFLASMGRPFDFWSF